MINVDDRLVRIELKAIGVDAFAVLMCITTWLGKKSTAWPGINKLREMTGLSKERTYNAIKKLIECGMVERWQENEKGVWGKVVYRVTTQYLSIYVSASAFQLSEPLSGNPEHGYPESGKPETGFPAHISINKEEVINKKEVINKREESAPANFQHQPNGSALTPPPDSAPPPSPKRSRFVRPEVSEMIEYMEDLFLNESWRGRFINNPDETAAQIHDYYTANGWKVGRNAMKDWKAACRNWLKNNEKYAPKYRPNVSRTPQQQPLVSEETHRRALARTLAALGVTGGGS